MQTNTSPQLVMINSATSHLQTGLSYKLSVIITNVEKDSF